jgi:hypothetical protein
MNYRILDLYLIWEAADIRVNEEEMKSSDYNNTKAQKVLDIIINEYNQ